MEEGDGRLMRVGVSTDLVVILFMGEEREGREGVVGGFGIPRAVLEEILLMRREVLWGRRCSFSSGTFALLSARLRGRFGSCRFSSQLIFKLVLTIAVLCFLGIPDLSGEDVFFIT